MHNAKVFPTNDCPLLGKDSKPETENSSSVMREQEKYTMSSQISLELQDLNVLFKRYRIMYALVEV